MGAWRQVRLLVLSVVIVTVSTLPGFLTGAAPSATVAGSRRGVARS